MQAQFIQEGKAIDYTPSAAVAGGDVIDLTNMIGVAANDIAASALGALTIEGVVRLPKKNESLSLGAKAYWDADGNPYGGSVGSGAATTTVSGNSFAGLVVEAVAETDSTVDVKLIPAAYLDNVYQTLIADPGDGEAIPVTSGGSCMLVSAGAETRTLADPGFLGQELLLALDTDGGNVVITAASAVNVTGNNTLTFADAGDAIQLLAITIGGALKWKVVGNDGVALSTV